MIRRFLECSRNTMYLNLKKGITVPNIEKNQQKIFQLDLDFMC